MDVKQKQWQLYFLGYYGNDTGDIDGIWGDKSELATKKFQGDNNLSVDGNFGPNTEAKSIAVIKSIQTIVKTAVIDGLAGSETVAATKVYQKSKGLVADGIAGPKTRAKVNEDIVEFEDNAFWNRIKHFNKNEFACKCGGKYCNGFPVEPDRGLVELLDDVREYFGLATEINSGIRCATHNTNVGGVANSRHKRGKAADIHIDGKTSTQILAYLRTRKDVNYSYAITSKDVHVDVK